MLNLHKPCPPCALPSFHLSEKTPFTATDILGALDFGESITQITHDPLQHPFRWFQTLLLPSLIFLDNIAFPQAREIYRCLSMRHPQVGNGSEMH